MFQFKHLGLISYNDALSLQLKERERLKNNPKVKGTVFLLEHKPVITVTKIGEKNLLKTDPQIEIVKTNRGGDITYHGPGQIVCYPIINLKHFKTDVHWYMRTLEEIIIQFLKCYGVNGIRIKGKTGVWIDENKKIASLGVHFSRWISIHGFSINIKKNPPYGFELINPCGFSSEVIVWLDQIVQINVDECIGKLQVAFEDVFKLRVPSLR